MLSNFKFPNSRTGSDMNKWRTAIDGREMVVVGREFTGNNMDLLYRDSRPRFQAAKLLEEGKWRARD